MKTVRGTKIGKALVALWLLGSNLLFGNIPLPKQPTIQQRIDAVRRVMPEKMALDARALLDPRDATGKKGTGLVEMAQFIPWGNWLNWSNWANWANWANWRNF